MNWHMRVTGKSIRCVGGGLLFLLLPFFLTLHAAAAPVEKLLEQHCQSCHSGSDAEGGLDLTALAVDFSTAALRDRWERVHDRLATGEMPPPDAPQPTPADRQGAVDWLDTELHSADAADMAREGRAGMRRMTRSEYENTLRDLLALPHLSLRELLPPDGQVAGFDKNSDGLEMSPVHLAAYTAAAEQAVTAAIATASRPPAVLTRRIYPASLSRFGYNLLRGTYVLLKGFAPDPAWPIVMPEASLQIPYTGPDTHRAERVELFKQQAVAQSESAVGLLMANVGDTFAPLEFSPIHAGRYRIRFSLWGFQWNRGEIAELETPQAAALRAHPEGAENRHGRTLGTFTAASLAPREYEIIPWLETHETVVLDPVSIPWMGGTIHVGGPNRWGTDRHAGPGVALDWVDVEGPLHESWPPESHRRLFGDLPIQPLAAGAAEIPPQRISVQRQSGIWPDFGVDLPAAERDPPLETVCSSQPAADARRLLAAFLPRAFRRPVGLEEVEPYARLLETRLAAGDCFEDAMRRSVVAILTSPEFLFHSPDTASDPWSRACRLSYWLWNAPPDETLVATAISGGLNHPQRLRAEVDRLLDSPKSGQFIDDFADQWLELRRIDETIPDRDLYPEYSHLLHEGMVAETRAFVHELIAKNLPISTLVSADFAFLTQRLAEHYSIADVEGTEVRRVSLPAGSHRGGLLTQAAILKLTANGTTTSPVKRGKWVIDRLLNAPPAPPPPTVAAIEPDTRGSTTIREQLARHQASASCAACHAQIDPAGFALEAFDPVGGFRTRYRALGAGEIPPEAAHALWGVVYRLGPPVDPSGQLADGRVFGGIDELKELLAADAPRLAAAFVAHQYRYATGSDIRYADRRGNAAIVSSTQASASDPTDFGVRSLIQALAAHLQSLPPSE